MIKNLINVIIKKTLTTVLAFDNPSVLRWLVRKYPKYMYLWWTIWKIKDFMSFFIFVYAMWFISNTCIPSIVCKEYVDIMTGYFNISNESVGNWTIKP